ncbi:hypothetical protein B7P34_04665 [Streptosporangium nondiastaticum]|uniref:Uncharacterized protein n=1 Tax=Streptosporangium nondiastaticum TaxID=35764 RepID=A0A9X7JU17_9ACTN|nr:hypothetical protein B7P34_04665 [Streptosporangium nondiastaticum]
MSHSPALNFRCRHWDGQARRYCGAPRARRYLPGYRCPLHTPSALAGRPEAPESPSRMRT